MIREAIESMKNLIGWLLHNANAEPPFGQKQEFYALKERILRIFGTCASEQVNLFTGELEPIIQYQHFPAKECWHCTRPRHWFCGDCDDFGKCCRCDGTGEYLPECWVELLEYQLGRFRFHKPRNKVYAQPAHVEFEGKIRHEVKPQYLAYECYLWLCLLFDQRQFFRALGRVATYGRIRWNRPMVILSTLVRGLRNEPWRIVRPFLPKRLYFKMRWQWFHKEPNEDSVPF